MLAVIVYSCFTSAYFTAFDFPTDNYTLFTVEHFVFASFTLDILLNFVRIQYAVDGS